MEGTGCDGIYIIYIYFILFMFVSYAMRGGTTGGELGGCDISISYSELYLQAWLARAQGAQGSLSGVKINPLHYQPNSHK
jgi:hypothetical protein